MTVNEIFEHLASNNSRTFKEQVLREHIDNDDLKEAIRLALDPAIAYYIRKIPEYSEDQSLPYLGTLENAMADLEELSSRRKTGNAGVEHLRSILSSISSSDAQVIEKIINKDVRCGIQTTPDKIWPGLIPKYPCMLASQFDQKLIDKIQWPAFFQCKMDGMRFNAIVKDGAVTYHSRNGKVLDILGQLDDVFIAMASGEDIVYDGELWVAGENGKPLERKLGNGLLQKAIKGTISLEEASLVRATVWDRITYKEFIARKSDVEYCDRRDILNDNIFATDPTDRVYLVETRVVVSLAKCQELFLNYLKEGEEGGILKTFDMLWEDKRSKKQIKFKNESTCDLEIYGWEYGTGKNKNRLGNLKLKSSDGIITTDCGSGFSDKQRDELILEELVGKIVEITYNARISDKTTGKQSIFLPIFQLIRDDKDVANSSEEIK